VWKLYVRDVEPSLGARRNINLGVVQICSLKRSAGHVKVAISYLRNLVNAQEKQLHTKGGVSAAFVADPESDPKSGVHVVNCHRVGRISLERDVQPRASSRRANLFTEE
jgi:hypothetical protein